jgi:hypothetical protein
MTKAETGPSPARPLLCPTQEAQLQSGQFLGLGWAMVQRLEEPEVWP